MSLQDEIDHASLEVKTDSYSMSIGELINLYKNGEIDLHPKFQRFFRWTEVQKTKLIESILLGIPLPPIFVAQRNDGVWDVIDGLQRLGSIFQFVGILKKDNGDLYEPLKLDGAAYLKSLKGKKWEDEQDPDNSLTQAQRLFIKRAKLDMNIILKDSDSNAKYELFQRLNTGGSHLSDQEVRNCILIMINQDMFEWIEDLSRYGGFRECITLLSDDKIDEQFDLELVLRFLIFRGIHEEELKKLDDIGEFLTMRMTSMAKDKDFDMKIEGDFFKQTFDIISQCLKEDAFRKYDNSKQKFKGGFVISAYEMLTYGIGYNLKNIKNLPQYIEQLPSKVQNLWSMPEFIENQGSGVRASTRITKIIPMARRYFSP